MRNHLSPPGRLEKNSHIRPSRRRQIMWNSIFPKLRSAQSSYFRVISKFWSQRYLKVPVSFSSEDIFWILAPVHSFGHLCFGLWESRRPLWTNQVVLLIRPHRGGPFESCVHLGFLWFFNYNSLLIRSIGYIVWAERTLACKNQECLWQDLYISSYTLLNNVTNQLELLKSRLSS